MRRNFIAALPRKCPASSLESPAPCTYARSRGADAQIPRPPVTPVAPGALPRSGTPKLLGSLAQRPAAGRQQPHRFPFEFIREFTARRARQTPSQELIEGVHHFEGSHFAIRHVAWLTPDDPRIRKWQIFCWRMTYYEIISFAIYYYKVK
jgi:hypothetical protein